MGNDKDRLRYGWSILLGLAGCQFYLLYRAFNASDWLYAAIHLFAGGVALGVGPWIVKLRWFSNKKRKQ